MRRQVSLGVAAAVSWAAETDKVSSVNASKALSCLFRLDSPDVSGLLVVAERCIGMNVLTCSELTYSGTHDSERGRCKGIALLCHFDIYLII